MGENINKIFLLIILILLQSCSGGRIGNFLESSFKNIEVIKIKGETKDNFKNKVVINSEENEEKNKDIKELKGEIKNNLNNRIITKSKEKLKKVKKNTMDKESLKKRKYKPQSYKIIFILKDVDPTDPIEDLGTILRNSDVNFEIEKIERFFDSKNKSIKKK